MKCSDDSLRNYFVGFFSGNPLNVKESDTFICYIYKIFVRDILRTVGGGDVGERKNYEGWTLNPLKNIKSFY
jgi:hypothetical protein